MSCFSAQWLAMREGADTPARSSAAAVALNVWLAQQQRHGSSADAAWQIVDLGCGSGANLRWLAPRIDGAQHWRLVDNDRQLLAQARHTLSDWAGVRAAPAVADAAAEAALRLGPALTAQLTLCDLSRDLPALDGVHLLSGSALLDLVSVAWLSRLIAHGARHRLAMLFALNYDGRVRFTPAHPYDAAIRDALNRDQRDNKGFGAALGPGCVAALTRIGAAHGYRVVQWRSDWRLDDDQCAMHAQLVDDFAQIARRRLAAARSGIIDAWHRDRHAAIARGDLRVGHVDVLALPAPHCPEDCR